MADNDFQKECTERVKSIAEHLDSIASGDDIDELKNEMEELEDNEPEEPDEDDYNSDDEYNKAYDEYEKKHDEWEQEVDELQERIDEAEENTLENYFSDCLDISYIVNGNREYESVRVWVTVGGPSIYVDTDESAVILNWGGTHAEWGITTSTRDAIDAYFSEVWSWG
jgi:hypothetical protein